MDGETVLLLVVIGIALGCGLMGAIVGIMIDRWIRETEQLDTRSKASEERAKAGKHARTQPRTTPVRNPNTGTWHLPIPGPSKPQPGRDSGAGTITFSTGPIGVPPKVSERLSVTGPIAKLVADNEAWMAQQAVEDEIFRLGLAT